MEVLVGVAIGLVLTFAVVAVITSSVTELLSGLWRLRAHSLEMGIARLLDDQTKLARPKRFWPLVRPSTAAPVTQAVLQHPLISSFSAPRAQDRPPSYINAVTFATAFLGSPLTTASLVAKVTEDRDRLDARIGGLGGGQPGDTVRRAWAASGKSPAKLVVALLGDDVNGIDGLLAVLGPAQEVEARIGQLRAAGDPATALIAETWQRATGGGGDHGKVADFLRKLDRPNLVTSALDGVQRIEDGLRELEQVNPHLGRSLAALWARAGADFGAFRREVEDWFDHEMDRVSGWYTRWAQWIMVAVAFAVAISFNLSAVTIGKALWNDPTLRAQAAAVAARQVDAASTSLLDLDLDHDHSYDSTGVRHDEHAEHAGHGRDGTPGRRHLAGDRPPVRLELSGMAGPEGLPRAAPAGHRAGGDRRILRRPVLVRRAQQAREPADHGQAAADGRHAARGRAADCAVTSGEDGAVADRTHVLSGGGDLNSRPLRPERSALPNCATTR